ncbi:hypothetical protein Vadar_030937 [Vaccinium darrowii]|uniref:Uncharacterized protein n=1 Tax=Vaccinium darrowii TaxID=229202 RepID=A0ACB7X5T6_9ERIC|nr:hypothetical protein Vadar_030937 [Vaccinium darrowii]
METVDCEVEDDGNGDLEGYSVDMEGRVGDENGMGGNSVGLEHTHPLTPGKGRRDLICDQYPNEHDKIRELSQQLAVEKKRAATYKRHLEMIFEHIEEHNESLSKKIQHVVDSVKEMESEEQQESRR